MLDTIDAPVKLWTPQAVLPYLTEAFRTDRATGGRIGPARLKAAWPDHQMEAADFVEQSLAKTLPKKKVRLGASIEQITRMEAVLGCRMPQHPSDNWLAGPLLHYPEHRERLVAWIFADLRGVGAAELCRQRGWSYATFKRLRHFAAGIIADRLNRSGQETW
jgi:hypothetical protein